MMNPIRPIHLTTADRLAEVASILALGLVRVKARQSSELCHRTGESLLDFSADQSGHATSLKRPETPE